MMLARSDWARTEIEGVDLVVSPFATEYNHVVLEDTSSVVTSETQSTQPPHPLYTTQHSMSRDIPCFGQRWAWWCHFSEHFGSKVVLKQVVAHVAQVVVPTKDVLLGNTQQPTNAEWLVLKWLIVWWVWWRVMLIGVRSTILFLYTTAEWPYLGDGSVPLVLTCSQVCDAWCLGLSIKS